MKIYLNDKQFLKSLDYNKDKDLFARITSLDLNDVPREQIEGQVIDGSINIDGASALRRTCSLNLRCTLSDTMFTNAYWCYNTKFKLEIGVQNIIDNKYPNIIWFDQGIYIISSFNRSIGTSSISVSIQGKDKMCRLNGEISGNLPMGNNFGQLEEVDKDGNITYTKLPIKTIIQQAVREYGQERPENIIINDLEDYGYELWDYRGTEPLYIIVAPGGDTEQPSIVNFTVAGESTIYLNQEDLDIVDGVLLHLNDDYKTDKQNILLDIEQSVENIKVEELTPDFPLIKKEETNVDGLEYKLSNNLIKLENETIESFSDETHQTRFKELVSYPEEIKTLETISQGLETYRKKYKEIDNKVEEAEKKYNDELKKLEEAKENNETTEITIKELEASIVVLESELNSITKNSQTDKETLNANILSFIKTNIKTLNKYWAQALQDIAKIEKEISIMEEGQVYLERIPEFYSFNTLDKKNNDNATKVYLSKPDNINTSSFYYVAKIDYGETAGYHKTELVYAGDLILNAGETVSALLDKITQMLGNFEYFYDLNGHFVFQKKKTYQWDVISPIHEEENAIMPTTWFDEYSYRFEDWNLITQISNTPNINEIKNDFSLWGQKSSGAKVPIHLRYAIDKKPTSYNSIGYYSEGAEFGSSPEDLYVKIQSDNENEPLYYVKNKYLSEPVFSSFCIIQEKSAAVYPGEELVKAAAAKLENGGIIYYPNTETLKFYLGGNDIEGIDFDEAIKDNTKQYYLKINTKEELIACYPCYIIIIEELKQNFSTEDYDWREIIYMMAKDYTINNHNPDFYIELEKNNPEYVNGNTGYEQYYSDILGFWRTLYSPKPTQHEIDMNGEYYDKNGSKPYWVKQIHQDPTNLVFWFDFLDTEGELGQYSVKSIGRRSKTINETTINSIYFKETPEIEFIVSGENIEQNSNYIPMRIQEAVSELFVISSQGNSALNRMNSLLYSHTAIPESLNITALPIYYLEPNTRIYIEGYGDYVLSKISYSLKAGSTMTLNGTKIIKEFI